MARCAERLRAVKDAPQPVEALGEAGVFTRMMEGLAAAEAERKTLMIDATDLKAQRRASRLCGRKGFWPTYRSHQGRREHEAHALADASGRPLSFFMTAGRVSDQTGAAATMHDLPKAQCANAAAMPIGLGTL